MSPCVSQSLSFPICKVRAMIVWSAWELARALDPYERSKSLSPLWSFSPGIPGVGTGPSPGALAELVGGS